MKNKLNLANQIVDNRRAITEPQMEESVKLDAEIKKELSHIAFKP